MLFSAIPIRDSYKVPHPESIVLLAKPSTIRLCVFIEVACVLAVFIFSFYYTATSGSTETRITFEILSDPYTCAILAPRKDIEEFDTESSELGAFSSPRYSYEECIDHLGEDGLDVCSDEHRKNYFLSLTGITVDSNACMEINLQGGTRLCLSSEQRSITGSAAQSMFKDSSEDLAYDKIIPATTYFFSEVGGEFHTVRPTFALTTEYPNGQFLTDFVVGDNNVVYVAAIRVGSEMSLYRMSKSNSSSEWLHTIAAPPTGLAGIATGRSCVFTYFISSMSKLGTITRFNSTSKVVTEATPVNCTSFMGSDSVGGVNVRWISYGTDGYLYALCTSSTTAVTVNGQKVLPVIQVDPVTLTTRRIYYAPIKSITEPNSGASIDAVSQVLQVGTSSQLIFLTSQPVYVIVEGATSQVQMLPGGVSLLSNLQLRTTYVGEYGLVLDNSLIYLAAQTYRAYNITSRSMVSMDADFLGLRYWATRIQLGYSYQVCNENHTNYVIDVDTSNSFYKQCLDYNGIYYQKASYFNVPSSCKSYINSTDYASLILSCPDVDALRTAFAAPSCSASFAKVCEAVYTENPPFSCERITYPSYIGVTATALANASGAWSLVFLLIKIMLRKAHFHYVHDFEYDKSKERYFNRNTSKIHTKNEYLTADVETGEDGMQSAVEVSRTDMESNLRHDARHALPLDKQRNENAASMEDDETNVSGAVRQ